MAYVEGFVVPVVANRLEDYRRMAEDAAKIWKEHGALSVVEASADNAPMGELTSFPRAVMLKDDEIVILSLIRFRDKADRDRIMDIAMKDPRFEAMMKNAPLDGKRLIWGGFEVFVDQ